MKKLAKSNKPKARPTAADYKAAGAKNPAKFMNAKQVIKHGIKRPFPGSITAAIWELLDTMTKANGGPVTRRQFLETVFKKMPKINAGTASVTYCNWTRFNGLLGARITSKAILKARAEADKKAGKTAKKTAPKRKAKAKVKAKAKTKPKAKAKKKPAAKKAHVFMQVVGRGTRPAFGSKVTAPKAPKPPTPPKAPKAPVPPKLHFVATAEGVEPVAASAK